MQAIRSCPDHGFFEGETCPVCEQPGEQVLAGTRRKQLSTFVSGALRHFPDDAGIELDEGGWTNLEVLTERLTDRYDWFEPVMLAGVVATDPKGRFERDDGRIRATYGHSVDVTFDGTDSPVPHELYHGTASENVASIVTEGLKPMDRQLVHLTDSIAEARTVGRRHAADPVILRIDAAGLVADGWTVTRRGRHVYTVDRVPPAYLEVDE